MLAGENDMTLRNCARALNTYVDNFILQSLRLPMMISAKSLEECMECSRTFPETTSITDTASSWLFHQTAITYMFFSTLPYIMSTFLLGVHLFNNHSSQHNCRLILDAQ